MFFDMAHAGTTLFQDDFNDGDNDGWTITRGDWDASAGHNEAITILDEFGEETAYTYAGDPAWENYILEVDITFGTSTMEFFIAVRAEPNSSLGPRLGKQYYLSVDGDNDVLRLRYTGGSSNFVDVQQASYTLLEQTTYHIKVLMNGVNLQASINGDALINYSFSAPEPIYNNGLFAVGYLSGFGAEGQDGAYFDNVKVYVSIEERVEALELQVEALTQTVIDLQVDLENHRHIYRTGKGNGHNNTKAKTGPAKFPATP